MSMLPEILLIVTAFVVLALDLANQGRAAAGTTVAGLLAALVALVVMQGPQDMAAWWFRAIFVGATLLVVPLASGARGMGFRAEFFFVILLATTGMMILVSARDLVTLAVSLELITLPMCLLTAWHKHCAASGEAALKYVVLGALASAIFLYGGSLLFVAAGSLELDAIGRAAGDSSLFALGIALVCAAAAFKLALAPFHMWAADVYEGAPTPVTAHLSVASKAAGMAFLFVALHRMMGAENQGVQPAIAALAALTMTWGNLAAIPQENIKRFMAYSSISQAGYLLLGALGEPGTAAMIHYLIVYGLANIAVFGAIIALGAERIDDFAGLSRTRPGMALALMLALFSLAGIPPLAGFTGKFFLFNVAAGAGHHWLVGLAAVNSTVSLYYYLRVVRQMYMKDSGAETPHRHAGLAWLVAAATCATVALGIAPQLYETIHAQTSAAARP